MTGRSRGTDLVATAVLLMSTAFAVAGVGRAGWVYYRSEVRPTLYCRETGYDFGQVFASDIVHTHKFLLSNSTEGPVEVIAVHVDCTSCMQVDWGTRVVKPGEKVTLQASLLPSTLDGHVVKRLRVYFQGNNEPLVLTLAANIVSEKILAKPRQ